jgi:hypothetical protein
MVPFSSAISFPCHLLFDEPINSKRIPIDAATMKIYEHKEYNWSYEKDLGMGGQLGIWASFLKLILGIGGEIGVSGNNENKSSWTCKILHTYWFVPTQEFVEQSVKDPKVREFFIENNFSEKLYMVTGLKIARGASSTSSFMKKRGFNAHVELDGTNWGVPGSIGPGVKMNNNEKVVENFDNADDFVFAFRLREIKVTEKGKTTHAQYTDGAMFGLKKGEKGKDEEIELVIGGIGETDVDGKEFGLEEVGAADDAGPSGEMCLCAKADGD